MFRHLLSTVHMLSVHICCMWYVTGTTLTRFHLSVTMHHVLVSVILTMAIKWYSEFYLL